MNVSGAPAIFEESSMKYEIDTIPVWDAVRAATECPLCLLEKRSRQAAVRYYLGPSVMVPEVRVQVNDVGFRPENLRLLAKDPNKLGLALISHTRLKTLRSRWESTTKDLRGKVPGKLKEKISAAAAFLRREESRCLIEAKVEADLERYTFTLLHLWLKDKEFRPAWTSSAGTCLHHAPRLLDRATEQLNGNDLASFVDEFLSVLDSALARVETDVLAFTQTFDGTNSHVIAGNPQGALDRTLQKMAGSFPEYEDENKNRRGPLMGTVSST
jgi:hypothetical protein